MPVTWTDIYDDEIDAFEATLQATRPSKEEARKEKERFKEYCRDEAMRRNAAEAQTQDDNSSEMWELANKEKLKLIKQKARVQATTSLRKQFMQLFDQRSYCNEVPGEALFYTFCSVVFKHIPLADKRHRLQFHTWILQDSGSGKDQAIDFFEDLVNRYNELVQKKGKRFLRPIKMFQLTGTETVESMLDYYPRDSKNPNKIDFEAGVTPGILSKYDILISRECSHYLTEGRGEKQSKSEILLTALEGKKQERTLKSWNGSTTVTVCNASFIGATRPFQDIKSHLVNSGLQQRGFNYCREVDIQLRRRMNNMVAKHAFSGDNKQFDEDMDTFLHNLMDRLEALQGKTMVFKDPEELSQLIGSNLLEYYEDLVNEIPSTEHRNILNSFVARFKDVAIPIAYMSAMIEGRHEVELQDLQAAFDLLNKSYEQIKVWIEGKVIEEKGQIQNRIRIKTALTKILTGPDKQPLELERSILKDRLSRAIGKSKSYAYTLITTHLQGENSLLVETEKNVITLRREKQ